ncbi:hypothetical protein LCGC14_0390710 [marine sediment metagenome]|uniref:Uncharacterized protein n=1 Tax=marine sediment metagenome TaxID=412755 RepID=A0A0F9VLU2_9ZZZZ
MKAIDQKIARLEEQSHRHWLRWQKFGGFCNLYYYKEANIKIRKLKGLYEKT